jgi:hypothetical protein
MAQTQKKQSNNYDIVLVGGGSAGITTAARSSRAAQRSSLHAAAAANQVRRCTAKIMYLADSYFRKSGVRKNSQVVFCTARGSDLLRKEVHGYAKQSPEAQGDCDPLQAQSGSAAPEDERSSLQEHDPRDTTELAAGEQRWMGGGR